MSKLYICEYTDGKITCKKIMTEDNEQIANKFAQKKAGGMSAKIDTHVVKDGSKIYTLTVFSGKDKEGYFVLQSNKPLTLNKSNIEKDLAKAPNELKQIIEKLVGKKLGEDNNNNSEENAEQSNNENAEGDETKQESILRYCLGCVD